MVEIRESRLVTTYLLSIRLLPALYKQKPPVHKMGREGILAVPPKLATVFAALFVLTNISLSDNVEITVQTNRDFIHLNGSRGNFN